MTFSKQIGQSLAETLDEMFLAEDMGLELKEIRDPERLRAEMKRLETSSHPTATARLERIQALHDRKIAQLERKEARLKEVKEKQHNIAQEHGYRRGKGDVYTHRKTGHTLYLHGDGSWSHLQKGKQRRKNGETPLRALKRHLKKMHAESAEPEGQELQEIRAPERIRAEMNRLSLQGADPFARQKLIQLQQLQRRKFAVAKQQGLLTMGEGEVGGYGFKSLLAFLESEMQEAYPDAKTQERQRHLNTKSLPDMWSDKDVSDAKKRAQEARKQAKQISVNINKNDQ